MLCARYVGPPNRVRVEPHAVMLFYGDRYVSVSRSTWKVVYPRSDDERYAAEAQGAIVAALAAVREHRAPNGRRETTRAYIEALAGFQAALRDASAARISETASSGDLATI